MINFSSGFPFFIHVGSSLASLFEMTTLAAVNFQNLKSIMDGILSPSLHQLPSVPVVTAIRSTPSPFTDTIRGTSAPRGPSSLVALRPFGGVRGTPLPELPLVVIRRCHCRNTIDYALALIKSYLVIELILSILFYFISYNFRQTIVFY